MKFYIFFFIFLVIFINIYINKKQKKQTKSELENVKNIVDSYKPTENFSVNNYIDEIFVIVMPQRIKHVKKSMKSYGINPKIINAVKKYNLDQNILLREGVISVPMNLGKVACHLSHVKALKKFLENDKSKLCMIFEDDIQNCFNKKAFEKRFEMMMKKLKSIDFDIIYLGKCHDLCENHDHLDIQLRANSSPLCRHAYIVNKNAAHQIVNNTFPLTEPGDHMVRKLIDEGKLKCITLYPSLFYQNRNVLGTFLNNYGALKECKKRDSYYGDFNMNPFYKVSVSLLNWNRPKNVDNILNIYTQYDVIDDIIVYNNNIKNKYFYKHPKVRVVNSKTNDLRNRYRGAVLAKNKAVLIQDDDILLPEDTIISLANNLLKEPYKLHGIFGRNIGPRYTYESLRNFGPEVDIVLTRAVMSKRSMSKKFLKYTSPLDYLFKNNSQGEVEWNNGEDIVLSLLIEDIYDTKPSVYNLKYKDFEDSTSNDIAIHKRKNHEKFRTKIIEQYVNKIRKKIRK